MSEKIREEIEAYPGSVLAEGFGMVGRIVMEDKRLSIDTKGLYAYLVSFGNFSLANEELVCRDLGINKLAYKQHLQQLTKCGYIHADRIQIGLTKR